MVGSVDGEAKTHVLASCPTRPEPIGFSIPWRRRGPGAGPNPTRVRLLYQSLPLAELECLLAKAAERDSLAARTRRVKCEV